MYQKHFIKALLFYSKISILAFFLIMLVAAGQSFAADVSQAGAGSIDLPSTTTIEQKDDLSAGIFSQLLGTTWQAVAGDSVSLGGLGRYSGLISQILSVANLAAMAIVSIIVLYTAGLFFIGSAQTGKAGGNKHNPFWTGVRTVLPFSMTVPVAGGISLLQVAVISVVVLGINWANLTWTIASKYIVSHVEQGLTDGVPPSIDTEARDAVQPIFQAVVFQELLKALKDPVLYPNPKLESMPKKTILGTVRVEGDYVIEHRERDGRLILWFSPGAGMSLGSIGGVSVPAPTREVKDQQNPADQAKYDALLAISYARLNGMIKMSEQLRKHAINYLATDPHRVLAESRQISGLPSATAIIDDYRETVMAKATPHIKALAASSEIGPKLSKALGIESGQPSGGWITAGILPFVLATASEQADGFFYGGGLQWILMSEPQPENTALAGSAGLWEDFMEWLGKRGPVKLSSPEMSVLRQAPRYATQELLGGRAYTGHTQTGDLPGTFSRVVTYTFYGGSTTNNGILSTTMSAFMSQNPISAIVWFGDSLMNTGLVCLGLSTGAGIAGMFPGVGVANEIVNNPAMIFMMGCLLIVGAIFTYIVPVYVLIVWIQAVIPWMISVCTTLFASPLWAVAHALPEGEGFVGQHARKGYVQLIDVAIRPFMLVSMLCLSYIMFQGIAMVIHALFAQWLNGVSAYSEISVIRQLIMSIIFVALMFIAYKTLAVDLLLKVPGQVITWIGGIGMSMGSSEHAATESATVVGGVIGQAGRTAGGIGSHVGQHKGVDNGKKDEKDKGGKDKGGNDIANIAPKTPSAE